MNMRLASFAVSLLLFKAGTAFAQSARPSPLKTPAASATPAATATQKASGAAKPSTSPTARPTASPTPPPYASVIPDLPEQAGVCTANSSTDVIDNCSEGYVPELDPVQGGVVLCDCVVPLWSKDPDAGDEELDRYCHHMLGQILADLESDSYPTRDAALRALVRCLSNTRFTSELTRAIAELLKHCPARNSETVTIQIDGQSISIKVTPNLCFLLRTALSRLPIDDDTAYPA